MHAFAGFDGRDLEWTDGLRSLFGSNLFGDNAGVAGCALSHFGIWRHVASIAGDSSDSSQRADPNADSRLWHLVMEDDVKLPADFKEQWKQYRLAAPYDADIIYLGTVGQSISGLTCCVSGL